MRGFKTLKTAYATIAGFEAMHALRKGQATIFNLTRDIRGEARIVERALGIGSSALTEAVTLIGIGSTSSLLDVWAGKRLGTTPSKPEVCNRAGNATFDHILGYHGAQPFWLKALKSSRRPQSSSCLPSSRP